MATALFPYNDVRDIQIDLVNAIHESVKSGKNLIAHAPTGLGKTAAAIAAALSNTIKTDKTIFFLTSMHTQHKIAVDTIRDIKKKHDAKIIAVDIIGKKHLCLQSGVSSLGPKEFSEYCKALREDRKCAYYNNLKKGEDLSFEAKLAVQELKDISPSGTDELGDIASKHEVCPYEIAMVLGKESKVIITDYYYMFNPKIRNAFLSKIGKELEDAVIIVDEAHNLPDRIKKLTSDKISTITIKRAISEAQKYNLERIEKILGTINDIFEEYAEVTEDELYIDKKEFIEKINEKYDYDSLAEEFETAGDDIREEQKFSYIGAIALFLDAWPEGDVGYTRIFAKHKSAMGDILTLYYKCLDPGLMTKPVIDSAASTIIMSGTLTPTYMYKEVLGFEQSRTKELTLKSPFPEENRLNIVVPRTSTKYSTRNDEQYKEIANIVTKAINAIPGNSAVFLPSYYLRDEVYKHMKGCEKTIFLERQGLTKQEKEELLENYKGYKNTGAALLAVTRGSFAEGIDLPGDFLKGVIVVGLPLQRPDLETKALIDYYDKKFNKGWDYGYIFPAFNKTLQSAGRCIRSETDRGVILFVDERYAWQKYMKCFPESWNLKVTLLFESMIKNFFKPKE